MRSVETWTVGSTIICARLDAGNNMIINMIIIMIIRATAAAPGNRYTLPRGERSSYDGCHNFLWVEHKEHIHTSYYSKSPHSKVTEGNFAPGQYSSAPRHGKSGLL